MRAELPPELTADQMHQALSAWRPGPTRDAIVAHLVSVTAGPDAVPLDERVAAFDHDGTTACEKPRNVLAAFLEHAGVVPSGPGPLGRLVDGLLRHGGRSRWMPAWLAGDTVEQYEDRVRDFLAEARHPRFDRRWDDLGYAPMRQLFALLQRLGFTVFLVSGGSRDLLRVFGRASYGLGREDVIGSEATVVWKDGRLVREDEFEPVDIRAQKPAHLWHRAGARALFAGGNSMEDLELLESAAFALVVHHDDATREYAYTDRSLLRTARRRGWTVASMSRDFEQVFAPEATGPDPRRLRAREEPGIPGATPGTNG